MMKSLRLHAIGDLRCDEVAIPVPHGKELLVKVGACGVCGSDLPRTYEHGTSNGKYPMAIGHEFSGEVVAVGEEADPSLIGVRAAIFPLIPGAGVYYTMNYAVQGQMDAFAASGMHTAATAGIIAVGILLASTLFRMWTIWKSARQSA